MNFPNYDEEIRCILPYYDSFHQETINLIKAISEKPAIWLDTGCGTGTLVERALRHFPDTKFLLADPSDEMLEVARRKISGSSRVTFLKPNSTQNLFAKIIWKARCNYCHPITSLSLKGRPDQSYVSML